MSQSNGFKLNLTPLKPADVPSEDTIIKAAQDLIESTTTWKQGKTFHKTVKTYQRPKGSGDDAGWHCRVSEHAPGEATFEQLWDKLAKDKALNEKEYMSIIKEVKKIKDVSPTASISTMYYTFKPPVSPRVYTVMHVSRLHEGSPRKGVIISIPIDLSDPSDAELTKLERSAVRGRYVSVETLRELENGDTEWRMATSGTPGGYIPSFFVESVMSKTIAEDVPKFMAWLHSLPN